MTQEKNNKQEKQELEKEIFDFTALRVWSEIFPAVLDVEKILKDKSNDCLVEGVITNAENALECLVIGYYKFHHMEKYLFYGQAREYAAKTLFLVYRLGFAGVLEKEKVLDLGIRFKESVNMINSLIKNLENKIKRLDESKYLLEKIRKEMNER